MDANYRKLLVRIVVGLLGDTGIEVLVLRDSLWRHILLAEGSNTPLAQFAVGRGTCPVCDHVFDQAAFTKGERE